MHPEAAKRLRLLASAISVLLFLAVLAVGWVYWRIRESLPVLDGAVANSGVNAPVTIERDAQGVPTIRGRTRLDVARALGWLHGQERFFQMDLLRRTAAGELAELFGQRAVARDRANRIHNFRTIAGQVVAQLEPPRRALLEAYAAGVNAGLGALGEKPFEYIVLREAPRAWLPEDTILVIHAMALDLQDETAIYERSLMTLRDALGTDALAFFAPVVTPKDAALDGTTAPLPPPPGPNVINLRTQKVGATRAAAGSELVLAPAPPPADAFPFPPRDPAHGIGSNAFALSGAHTASGAAMLANDMHLDHGVPTTWFRAVLEWTDPAATTGEAASVRRVAGLTLPGAPAIVAGTNGHVAWGFTNAYIDTVDLVVVDINSISRQLYTAPGHERMLQMDTRRETIRVKGAKPVTVEYTTTVFGPIIAQTNETERPLALRWTAHDAATTNLDLLDLENVTTVAEGIAVAHRTGIPAQNILLADRAGDIAWTIAGRVPKRVGFDGRLPVSWGFGDRGWEGYLPPSEIPVMRGADSVRPGRLWSANQRHVGGEALAKLGDGAYRRAHRAAQIRDALTPLERATPPALLAVQLDDRALFLERWHALLLETLTPAVIDGHQGRTALRAFAEKWEGRASTEAVSYRLVREFRIAVFARLFRAIFASCTEMSADFDWRELQLEPAFWALWEQQPRHLLPNPFNSWNELLVAACDDVIYTIDKQGVAMPKANWGWRNTARIRHPFSYSFPWLARWLDMPADPLPGGDDMPRVQSPTHGASERLVVSPGHEADGILHLPGGQSGHPLSPFYRASHDAWVKGEPTSFLPGATQHTLTLQP